MNPRIRECTGQGGGRECSGGGGRGARGRGLGALGAGGRRQGAAPGAQAWGGGGLVDGLRPNCQIILILRIFDPQNLPQDRNINISTYSGRMLGHTKTTARMRPHIEPYLL